MIIVRLLSPSLLVGFGTTKVYSGMGADIVMESITLIDPGASANSQWALSLFIPTINSHGIDGVFSSFEKGPLQDSNPELVPFLVDCILQNR
jgi:hypothetical protein